MSDKAQFWTLAKLFTLTFSRKKGSASHYIDALFTNKSSAGVKPEIVLNVLELLASVTA